MLCGTSSLNNIVRIWFGDELVGGAVFMTNRPGFIHVWFHKTYKNGGLGLDVVVDLSDPASFGVLHDYAAVWGLYDC